MTDGKPLDDPNLFQLRESRERWRNAARGLWDLLDQISSAADQFHPFQSPYRAAVERSAEQRKQHLTCTTDGDLQLTNPLGPRQQVLGYGTFGEVLEHCLAQATLKHALRALFTWENERAVAQAIRNAPQDTRDADGKLWDMCFDHCLAGLLEPLLKGSITPSAVSLRLTCEGCGELHIDEGKWATKLHHTHSCQFCGLTWRPAVGYTVGVRFLPGFLNTPPASEP